MLTVAHCVQAAVWTQVEGQPEALVGPEGRQSGAQDTLRVPES